MVTRNLVFNVKLYRQVYAFGLIRSATTAAFDVRGSVLTIRYFSNR